MAQLFVGNLIRIHILPLPMVQIVPLKMKRLKLLFPDEDMLDLLTVWLLKQALFDSLTGSSAFCKEKKKRRSRV